MKKILFLAFILSLTFSCKMYDNTIKARYVTRDPVGYDTTHYDKQNKPIPIYDSIYVVGPTWMLAYRKMHKNQKNIFWAGNGIFLTSFVTYGATAAPLLLIPIFVGSYMVASPWEWYRWNYDHEITKTQYDSLMKVDGDLRAFWDTKQ